MDFNFILDRELRTILIRDFEELQKCFDNKASKSVLILSGSIIEAILVDYMINLENVESPIVLNMQLSQLIQHELIKNALSNETIQISNVIKNYRNLIHPGREIRTKQNFDENTAQISFGLLKLIIKEIQVKYNEKAGYTAFEVIKKLESDDISIHIFDNILNKMNKNEKLNLFKLLIEYNYNNEFGVFLTQPKIFLNLVKKHIKQSEIEFQLQKLINKVNTSISNEILFYFFRLDNFFEFLNGNEFKIISEYINKLFLVRRRSLYNKEVFTKNETEICISLAKCYKSYDIDSSLTDILEYLISDYFYNYESKKYYILLETYEDIINELSPQKVVEVENYLKSNMKPEKFDNFKKEIEDLYVPF